MPEDLPPEAVAASSVEMHFLNYVACFMLACIVEFIALLPFLANFGMHHSSAAPLSDLEIFSQFAVFILHLPTSILFWLLIDTYLLIAMIYLTPVIQIIIWNFLFIKLWRKMNDSENKLKQKDKVNGTRTEMPAFFFYKN